VAWQDAFEDVLKKLNKKSKLKLIGIFLL